MGSVLLSNRLGKAEETVVVVILLVLVGQLLFLAEQDGCS